MVVIDWCPIKSLIKSKRLDFIRDFLGHSNVTTTEVYARADCEMKRKALEESYNELHADELPKWENDIGLMHWLKDLCK